MRVHHWISIALVAVVLLVVHIASAATRFSADSVKADPSYEQVPDRCNYLIPHALKFANPSWGLAQLDQESNCNPYATSPVGAMGIAQIMPVNLGWLQRGPCRHLGRAQPRNPDWAAPCYDAFMAWHTVDLFTGYCDNLHVDSMRYNGGFYIIWELREALARWGILSFPAAETTCGTRMANGRKRSSKSCTENYEYPERIGARQNRYSELGGQLCPFTH